MRADSRDRKEGVPRRDRDWLGREVSLLRTVKTGSDTFRKGTQMLVYQVWRGRFQMHTVRKPERYALQVSRDDFQALARVRLSRVKGVVP